MPDDQKRARVIAKLIQARSDIEDAIELARATQPFETPLLSPIAIKALEAVIVSTNKIIRTLQRIQ